MRIDSSLEIAAAGIGSPPASVSSVERMLSTLAACPSAISLPGVVLPDLVELAVADELDETVQAGQERRLAAADRHPLGGQRVAADLPAAVHLAEHHSSGTNTSSMKTVLNIALPVSSRSGFTSTPSLFMSSRK